MRTGIIPRTFVALLLIAVLGLPQSGSAQKALPIQGKGMYLWQLWTANGGGKNINTVVAKMKSVGATWLIIKLADGNSNYNTPNHSLYNWVVPNYGTMDSVISIFHANGIKLYGYQYVYGVPRRYTFTETETEVANATLNIKGIDGFVIDAEIQYDSLTNRAAVAAAYCDSIRLLHPDAFLALTAWGRVTGHTTFPWVAFLKRMDVNMPQTYWSARPTTPQNELSLMNSQFAGSTKSWVAAGDSAAKKPIMPIGQACYFGYGSDVLAGDITLFCDTAQIAYKYPGVSLWEYNQITKTFVWDEYTAGWKSASGVRQHSQSPGHFRLAQNFPNPFNPSTRIDYELPVSGPVTLKVFDVMGNEIATLVNERKDAGIYSAEFNAAHIASGVYFYTITAGEFTATKKLVLMK